MKSLNFTAKKWYAELSQQSGAVQFRGKKAGFRVRKHVLKCWDFIGESHFIFLLTSAFELCNTFEIKPP